MKPFDLAGKSPLLRFLAALSVAPRRQADWEEDPERVMAEAELSPGDKDVLRGGDWKRICAHLARQSRGEPRRTEPVDDPREVDGPGGPGSLSVVGTGLGLGQVTPEALAHLETADLVFHLGVDPVTDAWIDELHPNARSLATCFAEGRPLRDAYREMVERILDPVRRGRTVCAAFYGHPGLFVDASHSAVRQARREGLRARILPGVSAEDCLFADLGVDPSRHGWQSFEVTDFLVRKRRFDPTSALVLWQIGAIAATVASGRPLWNREGLSVLAEVLGRHYSATHEAVLYEASPLRVCGPLLRPVAVSDLPGAEVTVASTLYIPPENPAPYDLEMVDRLGLPRP